MSLGCIQGRKKNAKRRQFSFVIPKRLCARQTAFPCSFAKISKWRLGTILSLRPKMPASSMPNFVNLLMKKMEKRDEIKSLLKSALASTIYLSFSLPGGPFNLSQRFCLIRVKARVSLRYLKIIIFMCRVHSTGRSRKS